MERYSRQTLLPQIGKAGQKILQKKCIAIIGLGALGSVAAELLARAGIGKINLIDRDIVELSNLQRQLLYSEEDLGKLKAQAAQQRLQKINSNITYQIHPIHLDAENLSLLKKADLILDCTDNLATRLLVNDFCKKNKKTWIYSSALGTAGYVMPIFPDGPCLQCFLSASSGETCETNGVLNTITTSIASLQVSLALQLLLKYPVQPQLYYLNLWHTNLKIIQVKKNSSCLACQGKYTHLKTTPSALLSFCSSGKYQLKGKKQDFAELTQRWSKLGKVYHDGMALHFRQLVVFPEGRVLISASSPQQAQSLYSRYLGN